MKLLVTGSAGHLGEALVRSFRAAGHEVVGLDRLASSFTSVQGSINDAALVARCMRGVDAVLHTATLHKPHVATHGMQAFVDTNISGTLVLLEAAVAAGVGSFVYTSTTSTFGAAMRPAPGLPAAWITEEVAPVTRNIYGATKLAAEDLCKTVHLRHGLPCIVLRTSRFFAEVDDDAELRIRWPDDGNVKLNELLNRRVDIQDVVDAHRLAIEHAAAIGFGRYVISATTPFEPQHLADLRGGADEVVRRLVPAHLPLYAERGWTLFPDLDRVYVNRKAREELGWSPRIDFAHAVACLSRGEDWRSPLAREVGSKAYHEDRDYRNDPTLGGGPFPVLATGQMPR